MLCQLSYQGNPNSRGHGFNHGSELKIIPAMHAQNLGMKSYLETGFEEVVKLNWIHAGSEWALHPMTNVFTRERRRSGFSDTGEEDHVKVEGELCET